MIHLVPSIFVDFGQEGDFDWMLHRHEYVDALFVFNDNEEQWKCHLSGVHRVCFKGGGNATIRPQQDKNPPRAVGIPTGHALARGSGYKSLTPEVKAVIDRALGVVRDLVATGRYDKLVYSSDGRGSLGTGIFKVGQDVKDYIVKELHGLV